MALFRDDRPLTLDSGEAADVVSRRAVLRRSLFGAAAVGLTSLVAACGGGDEEAEEEEEADEEDTVATP